MAWLYDSDPEPPWPVLPSVRPRTTRGIRVPGRPDEGRLPDATDRDAEIDRFDYQAAAAWLRGADAYRDRAWLPAVFGHPPTGPGRQTALGWNLRMICRTRRMNGTT